MMMMMMGRMTTSLMLWQPVSGSSDTLSRLDCEHNTTHDDRIDPDIWAQDELVHTLNIHSLDVANGGKVKRSENKYWKSKTKQNNNKIIKITCYE